MNKQLAITTIEEVYNQVATVAPEAPEEEEQQFWDIITKHHPTAPDNPEELFKLLPRLGEKKLIAIATELGPLFSAEAYVYGLQAEYICNEFGKEAMDRANYGHGVEDGMISTKVYGVGELYTTFNINANNPDEVNADHEMEFFSKDEEE